MDEESDFDDDRDIFGYQVMPPPAPVGWFHTINRIARSCYIDHLGNLAFYSPIVVFDTILKISVLEHLYDLEVRPVGSKVTLGTKYAALYEIVRVVKA